MSVAYFSNSRRFSDGIMIVEAIIAIGLFTIISASVWSLIFESDNLSMKNLRRFLEVQSVGDFLEGAFFFSLESGIPEELPDSISAKYVSPCLLEIGESLLIADITQSVALGADCGDFPDFKPPSNITEIEILPNNNNFGTVRATDAEMFGDDTFFSLIGDTAASPDLAVNNETFDFGDSFGLGLNSLDVTSANIFAAANNISGQLAIFGKGESAEPTLLATSTLPGVSGSRPEGWSVFYYDERVYVGTRRTAGHEFHIFDVRAPNRPIWLGSREINHNINGIAVQNGLAFLATSGNSRDLIVLNVADPQNITTVLELDLPGNEDGRSLSLLGERLYLGRFRSTAGNPNFYIIDIGDVYDGGQPKILGSYRISADVNTVSIQHDLAIIGTSKPVGRTDDAQDRTVHVLNIASTTNITRLASGRTSQKVTGLDYDGERIAASVFGGENFVSVTIR